MNWPGESVPENTEGFVHANKVLRREEERGRRKSTSQSMDNYLDSGFLHSTYHCVSLSHLLTI